MNRSYSTDLSPIADLMALSVANNKESQQMGYRKVEFVPSSDFVAKDSWLTAFKLVDQKYRKNVDFRY